MDPTLSRVSYFLKDIFTLPILQFNERLKSVRSGEQ
jgi:hypothetical protein